MPSKYPFVRITQKACIRDMIWSRRLMSVISQALLNEGEIYCTEREVCERPFISLRTLQEYQDKGIIPYTQIADKIPYRLSDLQARELSEINYLREVFSCRLVATQKELTAKIEYICIRIEFTVIKWMTKTVRVKQENVFGQRNNIRK